MRRIVVALSGASGAIYGIRALELLRAVDDIETHLIMSAAGKMTVGVETALTPTDVELLADHDEEFY